MKKTGSTDKLLVFSWFVIILGLVLLIMWILGKVTGLINTPLWVSYVPHTGGVLTLLGFAVQLGKMMQKMGDVRKLASDINNKVGAIIEDVVAIKTTVNAHDKSIDKMQDDIKEMYK